MKRKATEENAPHGDTMAYAATHGVVPEINPTAELVPTGHNTHALMQTLFLHEPKLTKTTDLESDWGTMYGGMTILGAGSENEMQLLSSEYAHKVSTQPEFLYTCIVPIGTRYFVTSKTPSDDIVNLTSLAQMHECESEHVMLVQQQNIADIEARKQEYAQRKLDFKNGMTDVLKHDQNADPSAVIRFIRGVPSVREELEATNFGLQKALNIINTIIQKEPEILLALDYNTIKSTIPQQLLIDISNMRPDIRQYLVELNNAMVNPAPPNAPGPP